MKNPTLRGFVEMVGNKTLEEVKRVNMSHNAMASILAFLMVSDEETVLLFIEKMRSTEGLREILETVT